jgi:hypothetical protein
MNRSFWRRALIIWVWNTQTCNREKISSVNKVLDIHLSTLKTKSRKMGLSVWKNTNSSLTPTMVDILLCTPSLDPGNIRQSVHDMSFLKAFNPIYTHGFGVVALQIYVMVPLQYGFFPFSFTV